MAINKENSPAWVKITVWTLVIVLVFVWMGAGIFSMFDPANRPATQTPTNGTQSVADINTQYQSTVTAVEAALKEKPEDVNTMVSLASTYMDWGFALMQSGDANGQTDGMAKIASSVSIWEKAYAANPTSKEIGGDYATALYYSGQTDKAVELARKVLKDNPKYATVWYNLGMYLAETDAAEAIKAFENAVKFDTDGQYKQSAQTNIDALKAQPTEKTEEAPAATE